MRLKLLFFVPVSFVIAAGLAFRFENVSSTIKNKDRSYRSGIVGCSPDWNVLNAWIEELEVPPLPGSGGWNWNISSSSDSAKFYFNQGINTYYGFHIIESKASFQKAAKFDPGNAMIYWAQALAEGPNINDVGYTAQPMALAAIKKALEFSANSSEKEKLLIEAQAARYSADSTISREHLNQVYADKMKEAYIKYPNDPDIAALYADALMLQHPWDLWNINGTPKPWTPEIREVLEKILVSNPNHPGANHYYIHVMEPSPYADKALASADRLGQLTPGLSHMVHMPSHIYLRTGDYLKGALVNEAAVKSYKEYMNLYAPVVGNDFLYIIHNLHMQTNHAMMSGDSAYSIHSAKETVNSIPKEYLEMEAPLGNFLQYIAMTPVLVNVRFGNWAALLEMPQPAAQQIYANVLFHFGRGMAFSHQAKQAEAKQELDALRALMKDPVLMIPMSPFSPPIQGATVAENLLAGSISLADEKFIDAITAFTTAVTTEENMVYTEPRDWMLNPKHYLGNAYLHAGKHEAAQKVFLADLKNNNENGWALYGLYKSWQGQKKKSESQKALARYKKAFAKADIALTGPIHP